MPAATTDSQSWSFGSKKALLRTARDRLVRSTGRAPEKPDDLKRREESVFVQRARREAREKQRRKEQRFFLILLSTAIILLIVAAHMTYKAVVGPLPDLHLNGLGLGYSRTEVSSFQLAGVSPGMTPAMVRKSHADARTHVTDGDITVLSFAHGDADVTVWHLGQADGQQAFRIRTAQTFDAAKEDAVLQAMGRQFGRPVSESCDVSAISASRECSYSWRADAIDLRARTRRTERGTLELTLTAEDVQIRAFLDKHRKKPAR